MNNQSLSLISHSFSRGWELFKTNWRILLGSFLLFLIIVLLLEFVVVFMFEEGTGASIAAGIIISIVQGFLWLGLYRIYLDVASGKEASVDLLFSQGAILLNFIVASFLFFILVFSVVIILGVIPAHLFSVQQNENGFILLVFPVLFILSFFLFLFLFLKFFFYDFYMVDNHAGPIESLKQSWKITRGHWWSIFGLLILTGLLNMLGALLLFIGLLVTFPLALIIWISAYRLLAAGGSAMPAQEPAAGEGSRMRG